MSRRWIIALLAAASLTSTVGCCASVCGAGGCDTCGGGGIVTGGCASGDCGAPACGARGCGVGICNWYPGKELVDGLTCKKGCGKAYWSEWYNDPPDACDPCDKCGNWTGGGGGRRCGRGGCGRGDCDGGCGTCGGGTCGGGRRGYAGGMGYATGGSSCGCSGDGAAMEGGAYEGGGQMVPTPATASRARPTYQTGQRPAQPSYNQPSGATTQYRPTSISRQPGPRRVRPVSHVANERVSNDTAYTEIVPAEEIEAPAPKQAKASGPACITCRR
ncbi:MAG: hypothetical protein K8T25_19755 [Planctomycetia bacterium]|nr:hypothetical protein [Planctomycetia bacterium]